MEARGYGLPGRTSFHLFKMSPTDWMLMATITVTGIICVLGCALGKTSIYYYPVVVPMSWDAMTIITLISYVVLLALPLVLDIAGERKWQQLRLEI